jgi:replicative DNA helicase
VPADPRLPTDRAPRDHAAERAVLGGVLSDNQVYSEVATLLHPEDFDLPAHAAVYEAFVTLQHAIPARPIDQLTVTAELRAQGKLGLAGGPGYLAELEGSVPTTANTLSYARLVQEKSLKRRIIAACRDLAEIAVEPSTQIDALLDESQRRVFGIAERHQEGGLKPMPEVLDRTLEIIDQLRESGGGITGLPTGFADLDHMLTGLHPGELIVLAARPGVGKSALALNIASHAALKSKVGVAVFSLEMPNDQLAMRLLAAETRIDMKRIREGRLSAAHMEKIGHAASALYSAPMFIDDSGSLSSFDLRTKARRLQNQLSAQEPPRKLGLLVIDYLQLMHQRGRVESRQQEVQEISRSLKALAKELSLPVLALSQLNRKVEERRGKNSRPMLSDLRESGAIEQDADVVLFIHKEVEEGDEEAGAPAPGPRAEDVELLVAKQRNGPTGSVPLLLFSECTRFENKLREGMVQ